MHKLLQFFFSLRCHEKIGKENCHAEKETQSQPAGRFGKEFPVTK